MVRPRPGMMFRGMLKVVLIAIAASQILTAAFTVLARQIDAGLSPQIISVFGFVTCGLVSMWLQADARRLSTALAGGAAYRTESGSGHALMRTRLV
jgi:hypothetical protein